MIRRILLATLAAGATGFTVPSSSVSTRGATHLAAVDSHEFDAIESFDPLNLSSEDESPPSNNRAAAIAAAAMMMVSSPLSASAAGPDWGIFEGRSLSLLHPIMMASMAIFSVSTALLGFQWRRQRTLGDEISALKKTMPNLNGASSLKEALAAAEGAESGVDASYVASLKAALPTESQVAELTKERKDLASAGPRDKHFNQGSLLFFLGITFAIEVCFNTCDEMCPVYTSFVQAIAISIQLIINVHICSLSLATSRDHSTRTLALGNSSQDHTSTRVLVSSYSGHSRPRRSLPCKKAVIPHERYTLVPTWLELDCLFGKLQVVFPFCSRFLSLPSGLE